MRAVVQRVSSAAVHVEGRLTGAIERGLLVLVGVGSQDEAADVEYMAGRIRDLRIFPDEAGKMNRDVGQAGGAVLLVSQFTLFGDVRNGRRPSFVESAPPELARGLYEGLAAALGARGLRVETGEFRAHMDVSLVNDGPVTILIDSRKVF
ncbi:MAG TPA: D-aminoacyl-tRNA deacylase [Vicinamibacterales bacterium]|nr:D-aminoacyl-tRNA deacylase [Vicinamibacterales bacterium]